VIETAGWAAFRCSLTGVASDRQLEVPVCMFYRAGSQGWQAGTTPAASAAALGALGALLHDVAGVRDGTRPTRDSSAASGSQGSIPRDADATSTETTTARGVRPPSVADLVPTPYWQMLPEDARVTLTELMIRLILDHAAGAQASHRTEARHEA
jgi:hypothetical protein